MPPETLHTTLNDETRSPAIQPKLTFLIAEQDYLFFSTT